MIHEKIDKDVCIYLILVGISISESIIVFLHSISKIIWLIGFILLAFLFNEIQLNVEQKIKTTFDPTPLYWANFFITFKYETGEEMQSP